QRKEGDGLYWWNIEWTHQSARHANGKAFNTDSARSRLSGILYGILAGTLKRAEAGRDGTPVNCAGFRAQRIESMKRRQRTLWVLSLQLRTRRAGLERQRPR